MQTTTLLTPLLLAGIGLAGCASAEFRTPDQSDPIQAERLDRPSTTVADSQQQEQDCGMESCAPEGTVLSTMGALRIPIRENYQITTKPPWSPADGEMVRIHIQQNVRVPRHCAPGDCGIWDYPGVCEVLDQDGRLLWRQFGSADQWLHVRGVESIQTRVEIHAKDLGCDMLFGHDHHCTVSEVEVIASAPAEAQEESSCNPYLATDFSHSTQRILSINGDASQRGTDDAGELVLTDSAGVDRYSGMGAGYQAGSAFGVAAISDPGWTARFSFEIEGGTGADGMTFAFVDARTPDALGGGGSKLGVEGLWGYAVEFDTFQNDNDPNDNHIALIDTLTGEHLVIASDIPQLQDGGEFEAEVRYDHGQLKVWLDGVPTLSAMLSDVPNFIQPAAILGFTAATGAKHNTHIVDDVIMRPLCDTAGVPDTEADTGGVSDEPDEADLSTETAETYEVAAEEWLHFSPIEIDHSSTLVLTMSGTEDADLYARKGAEPTQGIWDCRPFATTSEEECRLEGAGVWYFGIRGYGSPFSTVTLSVTIEERASDVGTEESGTLAEGEWDHFGPFSVEAGTLVATLTGEGDADLYVRQGAEPTSTEYDCRSYSATSDEECRLDGPGDFYVSVNAYAAATYALSVEVES